MYREGRRNDGGELLMILHAIVMCNLASLQSQSRERRTRGFRRTRLAISYQVRSAVMPSVTHMKGEPHPAEIALPEAY